VEARAALEQAEELRRVLEERTLEFARHLMETSAEALQTQDETNHGTLDTLTEESRKHREAMENLLSESTKVYKRLPRSPFSHHQDHSKFEEATEASEVRRGR